jgi:hypothetical protein
MICTVRFLHVLETTHALLQFDNHQKSHAELLVTIETTQIITAEDSMGEARACWALLKGEIGLHKRLQEYFGLIKVLRRALDSVTRSLARCELFYVRGCMYKVS